jgi:hypothetical protein
MPSLTGYMQTIGLPRNDDAETEPKEKRIVEAGARA